MDTTRVEINDIIQVQDVDDPNSLSYHSRVEDIASEHMVIAWPTSNGMLVPIHLDRPLSLSFVREDAAYVFSAVVQEKKQDPVPLLKVRVQGPPKRIQRRQYFRLKVPIGVKIQGVMNLPENPQTILDISTQVYDLSGSGLAIRSEIPIPIGTMLDVRLLLLPNPLKLLARVVSSELLTARDGRKLSHIGFNFVDIKEGQRMRIIRYLFQRQLKQLANARG